MMCHITAALWLIVAHQSHSQVVRLRTTVEDKTNPKAERASVLGGVPLPSTKWPSQLREINNEHSQNTPLLGSKGSSGGYVT